MDPDVVVIATLFGSVVVANALGRRRRVLVYRRVAALVARVRPPRPAPPRPLGRPIEAIARDAQRLRARFEDDPRGSFAQFEGCRRALDQVLAEACRALEVEHLLGVLPPGPDLDRERERVEAVLEWSGLRHDDFA
jgi:hypothetical protein